MSQNLCSKTKRKVIWEKGTNRAAFFRGEIDKYSWVDAGSSFSPVGRSLFFLGLGGQFVSFFGGAGAPHPQKKLET